MGTASLSSSASDTADKKGKANESEDADEIDPQTHTLVEAMATLAPPPGEDRGVDGENVSSILDAMVRLVVGGLYTTLHAADPAACKRPVSVKLEPEM